MKMKKRDFEMYAVSWVVNNWKWLKWILLVIFTIMLLKTFDII